MFMVCGKDEKQRKQAPQLTLSLSINRSRVARKDVRDMWHGRETTKVSATINKVVHDMCHGRETTKTSTAAHAFA